MKQGLGILDLEFHVLVWATLWRKKDFRNGTAGLGDFLLDGGKEGRRQGGNKVKG